VTEKKERTTLLRSRRLWLGLAALAVLAAVMWSAWVIAGGGDEENGTVIAGAVTAISTPAVTPKPPLAVASQATPTRIVIPSISVDAPVSVKGMGQDGTMEPPNGPEDVAWYAFTGRPGGGGNAVFSGHVDYRNYGPAVFAGLKELKKGDLVEVRLEDNTIYRYQVVLSTVYPAETAPFEEIVGATSRETITLITCTGVFDSASRQYSQRLVVRAERM